MTNTVFIYVFRYDVAIPVGVQGCNASWDSILGEKWDVLSRKSESSTDFLIRTLNFKVHQDVLMNTIRCHMCTMKGDFSSTHYRDTAVYNAHAGQTN